MADNTVTTKFVADPRDEVVLQLLKQQKETTNLQKRMLALSQSSRRSAKDTETGISRVTRSLGSMVAGYASVTAAVGLLRQANEELIQQQQEAGQKFDDTFRKFRVQSGLRGLKAEEAQQRIQSIANERAFDTQQAGAAATQLVSSGFSAEQASGKSLDEFLKILNASNIVGRDVDPKELAQAVTSFLNSQNLDLNQQNLATVGRGVQAQFRGKNIQLPDLVEFSKQASNFVGRLSIDEQIGTFAQLRQSIPAAEATTGFRNFVNILSSEGDKANVKGGLKKLGLTKEDVDFSGENLNDVLNSIAEGLKDIRPEEQDDVLSEIFGRRSVAVARTLIGQREQVAEAIAANGNTRQFESDVTEAEAGRNAAERRLTNNLEQRRAQQDQQDDLFLKSRRDVAEQLGFSTARILANELGFKTFRAFGVSQERAASLSSFGGVNEGEISDARVGATVSEIAFKRVEQALRENTAALKEQKKNPKPQPVEVVNEPQRRRQPAAAAVSN